MGALGDLPNYLTSFVGRETELAELESLFAGTRMLTVAGAGGCGKTRLVRELALRLTAPEPHEVWFCDFSRLDEPAFLAKTVAAALDVQESANRDLLAALVERLQPHEGVLVFDSCEHLLDAAAALAETLLRRCPRLKVIATSRVPLGVGGEVAWRTPSLRLEPGANAEPEAVQLFIERARASSPMRAWEESDLAVVSAICAQLDGIPLAIELAAARVAALSLPLLSEQLAKGLDLLSGGSRTALPRHQTLRRTIDWSYQLLDGEEKSLFRRLSVFAGGWTLDAAEAVCATGTLAAADVVVLLAQLVEKSIVLAQHDASSTRYRLLEPLRGFAREQLNGMGETETFRRRHCLRQVALAEQQAAALRGSGQLRAIQRLEEELNNLRAALAWTLDGETAEKAENGERIVSALFLFWYIRGYLQEAEHWATTALGTDGRSEWRGGVFRALGTSRLGVGRAFEALEPLMEAVEIERARGDRRWLAESLLWLGVACETVGDGARAFAVAEEAGPLLGANDDWLTALRLRVMAHAEKVSTGDMLRVKRRHEEEVRHARAAGDSFFLANVLNCLAEFARWEGHFGRAKEIYDESLALRRALGDRRGIAQSLVNLGMLAAQAHDPIAAASFVLEALARGEQIGSRQHRSTAFTGTAAIAALLGSFEEAGRFLGTALTDLYPAHGLDPPDLAVFDWTRGQCLAHLREERLHAAMSAGEGMAGDEAVAAAIAFLNRVRDGGAITAPAGASVLSPREQEVLDLVGMGLANREIAERLVLSVRTVESHIANICGKLGVRSRAGAVLESRARGLLADAPARS